MLSQLS